MQNINIINEKMDELTLKSIKGKLNPLKLLVVIVVVDVVVVLCC